MSPALPRVWRRGQKIPKILLYNSALSTPPPPPPPQPVEILRLSVEPPDSFSRQRIGKTLRRENSWKLRGWKTQPNSTQFSWTEAGEWWMEGVVAGPTRSIILASITRNKGESHKTEFRLQQSIKYILNYCAETFHCGEFISTNNLKKMLLKPGYIV